MRADMWLGVIGTAVWLTVGVTIVIFRWEDLSSLQLNTIGDTLSGFVAPLAFLWLIVATWLQRQELGLQRRELQETRSVLANQQKELESSARESAEQTKIMQSTLNTSLDQVTFEEHRLRMYYLAKYIATVGRSSSLLIAESNGNQITPSLYNIGHLPDLNEDMVSVDTLLVDFARRQRIFRETIIGSQFVSGDIARERNEKVRSCAKYILKEIEDLSNADQYISNSLISARLKGIEFDWIKANIEGTVDVLFSRTI
jgi:hypothetical protein